MATENGEWSLTETIFTHGGMKLVDIATVSSEWIWANEKNLVLEWRSPNWYLK